MKLIITNYPEGQVEELEAINNPEDPEAGSHPIEFSRELWMEREDFMEDAPKKYFRMTPGQGSTSQKCLYRKMYRLQEKTKTAKSQKYIVNMTRIPAAVCRSEP